MSFTTLALKTAAALDAELMSTQGFLLDQLMELAGQAVAHAVYRCFPPTLHPDVLVVAGPGNNGGDGLVAARHLQLLGYRPRYYYPRHNTKNELFARLEQQLRCFRVPEVVESDSSFHAFHEAYGACLVVVDAMFGFSFAPPAREPFASLIAELARNPLDKPVVAVDIPTGWDVDSGPPDRHSLQPDVLVLLTAPKPCSVHFTGRHFVGGRFVSDEIRTKYGLVLPTYPGADQVVEIPVGLVAGPSL